jgi:hypothetical protein
MAEAGQKSQTYIGFAWGLDQILCQGVADLKAILTTKGALEPEPLEQFIINLRATKIPFDLLRGSAEPFITVIQEDGEEVGALLCNFFIPDQLPFELKGWYSNMDKVREVCHKYQMPSLVDKVAELGVVTIPHPMIVGSPSV